MSLSNLTLPSPRTVDSLNSVLVGGRWVLVLAALALTQVILVQAGLLPWTLSEADVTFYNYLGQ